MGEPVMPRSRIPAWLMAVLLGALFVALMVLVYLPAERGGYIWDDDAYVTENLTLRSTGGLTQIWGQLTATPQYYPVVHTSFWLEYHLWALNPLGYHVVNVLLHALASVLLWRVLVRLQLPGAWLAAGIFALHPVAVESVAWVTERKNVLSAVFYFASALAYLRWTGTGADGQKQIRGSLRWYFIAFGLFIAALLSKTTTCSLPAALLLVFWWKRGRMAGREVWPLLPFFAAGVALGLLTAWLERTHVAACGPEWAFSFPERCLIAGRAVWFYAEKLFWPANLAFIYPRWRLNVGMWWQWLFPLAALAVVVVLWCWRHRLGRGPVVAVLFFAGTLFPALGFINVYPMRFSFVADHFQYLASVGLIVMAVAGLANILRPLPLAAAVLPLGLAVLTWQQSHIYANQETLWQDTLAKNPACWMAHNNLGLVLYQKGQIDEALSQFQEALRLKPDYPEAHNNLGTALVEKGQTDEAISQFQEALRLKPDYPEAHYNLGTALGNKGQTDEAISHFQEAVRLKPDYTQARYNLGIAFEQKGQTEQAISQFQETIRLNPDLAEVYRKLGAILDAQGKTEQALACYRELLRLRPDEVDTCNNLAWTLATHPDAKLRDGPEAVRLAEHACDLTGYQVPVIVGTLAAAYAEAGRFPEAVSTAEKAIALAAAAGQTDLAERNRQLLELYKAGKPYHEDKAESEKAETQNERRAWEMGKNRRNCSHQVNPAQWQPRWTALKTLGAPCWFVCSWRARRWPLFGRWPATNSLSSMTSNTSLRMST